MTHRIRCALNRTISPLLAWLGPTTKRSGRQVEQPGRSAPRTHHGLQVLSRDDAPPYSPAALRHLKRPTAHTLVFADQAADPLVRPYFLAHECRARSTEAAPTPTGLAAEPSIIHGHRRGTPAIPGMAVLGMGAAA